MVWSVLGAWAVGSGAARERGGAWRFDNWQGAWGSEVRGRSRSECGSVSGPGGGGGRFDNPDHEPPIQDC
jgi:hypothetical protein